MAVFLRRAFLYRNVFLRSSTLHGRKISCLFSFTAGISHFETQTKNLFLQELDFLRESRRGFAKGRKSKDDSATSIAEELPDMGPTIKANCTSQMEAAIAALSGELSKLRTGRASAGILDHIIVEIGDVKLPLNQIAVVSVLDSKTLSINPFDLNALKNLESAIVSSPFGLNPRVDGERLIAAIPPLTKEHIQAVCKVVAKSCEDARQSIRRARQKWQTKHYNPDSELDSSGQTKQNCFLSIPFRFRFRFRFRFHSMNQTPPRCNQILSRLAI